MTAIYGLYPDPGSAERAFQSLRRPPDGVDVSDNDIVILSSEPFEEYEFGRRGHRTVMPWLAALGGLAGGLLGFLFVSYTQRAYPLPTGGMKIVSLWPDGVITYELIMLSAILTTLVTLLITARSPRRSRKLYDPQVSEGKILVGVVNPAEASSAGLERMLRDAGASSVVSCP
ncbi:MAG TPA: quinol:electron acceptor oxidoreductase subunit ActD [Terriglobia bacterium]|nr:quinol:electron acceptor oxidoreductase subunit ActD [Terriglobia bacterium]